MESIPISTSPHIPGQLSKFHRNDGRHPHRGKQESCVLCTHFPPLNIYTVLSGGNSTIMWIVLAALCRIRIWRPWRIS